MSLPNYFFADLPADATLSPAMINAACETLKRNRTKFLEPRKTADIVSLLCEVAAGWRHPDNKFRRLALASASNGEARAGVSTDEPCSGFSAAVLAHGLDDFFHRFTPGNFQALLDQDLGVGVEIAETADSAHASRITQHAAHLAAHHAFWHGPQLLVHVAAGNLPNPALMSLTLGLLTRSAQFMKCASGASYLPRLFAHSIYEADPKLGACLELAEWRGGKADLEAALFGEADAVTATGSDEALAAIRARVPAAARFLGYGQRVSMEYVTREGLREETIAQLIASVADDVIAWDQNGCLSPHVIYVEEKGQVESDKFAEQLAVELMRREMAEPRGPIPVAAAADIAARRSLYETLAAHRGDVKLWQSQNTTAWTVVFEHDVRFRLSPLNRFVFVKPVPDLATVMQGVDELKGKISTVAVATSPERLREIARQLARWGVTRICRPGRMQNPPLTWRHDGRPALGDLVSWTDFAAEESGGN